MSEELAVVLGEHGHVWDELGHSSVGREAWRLEDDLVVIFEQLLKEGRAPRGGWRPVAAEMVKGRPVPELLPLVRDVGLGGEPLPAGTTPDTLAGTLRAMFVDRVAADFEAMERRWRDDANFELKKRKQTRRQRGEPIDRPFTPPSEPDPGKMG